MVVLAHEIAHHYNGDPDDVIGPINPKQAELSADRFAGAAIRRLGGTLEEAIAGYDIFEEEETTTHPSRSARVLEVIKATGMPSV